MNAEEYLLKYPEKLNQIFNDSSKVHKFQTFLLYYLIVFHCKK
jgi:hypothetical protein